jgi:hypothetical protein
VESLMDYDDKIVHWKLIVVIHICHVSKSLFLVAHFNQILVCNTHLCLI